MVDLKPFILATLFGVQWNAEIRTSLDFGRSKIVWFEIVRFCLDFGRFFCLKAKLWY